jgi:serine/threonine protein kinase
MGDAAQAQEAEALASLKLLLPDDGIARAWANLTFTDNNGNLNEVDLLLLTRAGLSIVELKGWHGEITGNQQTWSHAGRTEKNPRHLANAKAKRLGSVLSDMARKAGLPKDAAPYVGEAVVLHGRDSLVALDEFGAESIWALDGYNVKSKAGRAQLRPFTEFLLRPGKYPINLQQAKVIDKLLDAAGLMPRAKQRMIGQYALDSGEPLGEGPGWQDYLVTHPLAKAKRRVRLFPYPRGASKEDRAAIDTRAAREFGLTNGMVHRGIIKPLDLFSTEEGAALLFDADPSEVSLADYLAQHESELTFEQREQLVQELSELVRFAHSQRLTHRALSPLSVRVSSNDDTVEVCIRDWDLARRPSVGTSTMTEFSRGLTDIVGAVESDALLYLAPETLRGAAAASAQTLDIYGVGAVAFTILTKRPPAANLPALEALVASDATGLDPRAVMAEIPDAHAEVIVRATAFFEGDRLLDIAEFQTMFEEARRSQRTSDPAPAIVDPLDASVGDIIGERFEIVSRRGAGSTGVALEVSDYGRGEEGLILKLAKDDAAAARLTTEAAVLDRLDHPRVVKRLDGPLTVGTRQGLLMTDAGLETLADRIRLEGRATIEQLERYGADLFDAMAHLESRGVFHRDLKPSNIAIRPDPGNRKPRLTLFDFSLAEEPLTNVKSGSRPYLDPFLGSAGRSQYDSAAERFAVAATLFELATANPIWWSEGDAPSNSSDAPIIHPSAFDAAVADGLVDFFRNALAPNVADRHPSLDAMRAAWAASLAGAAHSEGDEEANDAKAAAATLTTPLSEAGLSARALSALGRVKATTVGELLGVPPMQINQVRGLGEQVRREISGRIREWRLRLAAHESQTEVPVAPGRRAVENYLGTISVKGEESSEDRYKRLRKNGTLKPATEDAARWLQELGGIATLDEIATKLLREYGSTLADPQRIDAALEVARAVLELDFRSSSPLFVFQSPRDAAGTRRRTIISYAPDTEDGLSFDEAEEHLEALIRLGGIVDKTLDLDAVVSSARLREALAEASTTALRIPETRQVQLAVALSTHGSVSSMGEAYRLDLDASRAVELALRGAATRELAIVTIEQRTRARFPSIRSIPARPELDNAVRAAIPSLEWNDDKAKYVLRGDDTSSLTRTASSTTWGRAASDPAIAERLSRSIKDRGALTIVVSRKQNVAATAALLARENGLRLVDLADLALDALKAEANGRGVDWPVVLKADGQPADSQDHKNLIQLAKLAIEPAWTELLAANEPLLVTNAAVIARLGLAHLIADVTDLASARPAARWFLLPRPLSGSTPDLDGRPMPFGADGWIELSLDLTTPSLSSVGPAPTQRLGKV